MLLKSVVVEALPLSVRLPLPLNTPEAEPVIVCVKLPDPAYEVYALMLATSVPLPLYVQLALPALPDVPLPVQPEAVVTLTQPPLAEAVPLMMLSLPIVVLAALNGNWKLTASLAWA